MFSTFGWRQGVVLRGPGINEKHIFKKHQTALFKRKEKKKGKKKKAKKSKNYRK